MSLPDGEAAGGAGGAGGPTGRASAGTGHIKRASAGGDLRVGPGILASGRPQSSAAPSNARRQLVSSLGASLWPFVVGRVLVVVALEAARFVADRSSIGAPRATGTTRSGLFSWDASWYLRIAEHGYAAAGRPSLRFFPLLPLLVKALHSATGLGARPSLLLVTTVATLVALMLVHRLVLVETADYDLARRSVWLLALAPAAFVLVMGYAEPVLLALAAATFLAVRTRHFAWAVLPAFAAGLCRPVGMLLAVPVVIEALVSGTSGSRRTGSRALVARGLAVLAAPAGAVAYLAWAAHLSHDFLSPLTEQLSARHRGTIADPAVTLFHDVVDLLHRQHLGTALHAPFAVLFVVLMVAAFRHWPVSYGAYALVTLAVALSAPNLDSLERYGVGCFVFSLSLASLVGHRRAYPVVLVCSGVLLFGLAALAFLGLYVP